MSLQFHNTFSKHFQKVHTLYLKSVPLFSVHSCERMAVNHSFSECSLAPLLFVSEGWREVRLEREDGGVGGWAKELLERFSLLQKA